MLIGDFLNNICLCLMLICDLDTELQVIFGFDGLSYPSAVLVS